jgi:O-antigen/teichoic acid export membrane protein
MSQTPELLDRRRLSIRLSTRRFARHPVVRGGMTRLVTLPVTALASFATTAITVRGVGVAAYGYIAMIATLGMLIPFADLGLGAAVQSATAVSISAAEDDHLQRVLRSSLRLLAVSGATIGAVGIIVALVTGWTGPLRVPATAGVSANVVIPIVLVLFGCGLPFGVGMRVLIGIQRNDVAVLLAAAMPAFALVAVCVCALLSAPRGAYAVAQPAAMLSTAIGSLAVAARLSGIKMIGVIREALKPRRFPGTRVSNAAAPMFVIMVALPLALQSDRIILAQRSTAAALTEYALAAQVYAAAWSVLYAAGVGLWPLFAQTGAAGRDLRRPWLVAVRSFGAAGILGGGIIFIALPFIVAVVSGGRVVIPVGVTAAFAALLAINTAHLPSAMLLTTPRLLRFQAAWVLVMLIGNIGMSWALAAPMGAAGPVLGSAITVGLTLFLPAFARAGRVVAHRPSEIVNTGDRGLPTTVPT